MGILQAVQSSGITLAVSGSNVNSIDNGFIGCGHPPSTNTPALSVGGGTGNYTFEWVRTEGNTTYGPWVCSNITVQNPAWHAPGPVCADATDAVETWECTVTDIGTGQVGKAEITVTILWFDLN